MCCAKCSALLRGLWRERVNERRENVHLPDLRIVLISCVVFAAGGIVFGLFLVYGMERLFGLSLGIAKTPINVVRIAVAFLF